VNRNRLVTLAAAAAALVLLGAGFMLGTGRSLVAWGPVRAVVFESDDWGLAGFIPDAQAWEGIDRTAVAPGRFPEVYWGSTLEDSAGVAALAKVLASVRGRDGLPAVLQPNYVMGSQDPEGDRWVVRLLPDLPPAYARPGLWTAVRLAERAGVWHPEFHAAWHYDPARRREAALAPGAPRQATERGILLFPGSEQARELGPWRGREALAGELDDALDSFTALFGRPPGSIIAPDYTWNGRVEDLWQERGQTVIQAKREQRNPDLPHGRTGRVLKALDRRWSALVHPGRIYLERNCRFEPVQSPDPAAVTRSCAAEVRRAWQRGEPAIVETHRVNFAHTDPAVAAVGTAALGDLLAALAPGRPVFLVDSEVAALQATGVSARAVPGAGVIVRNLAHSRRPLALPGGGVALIPAGASARIGREGIVPIP